MLYLLSTWDNDYDMGKLYCYRLENLTLGGILKRLDFIFRVFPIHLDLDVDGGPNRIMGKRGNINKVANKLANNVNTWSNPGSIVLGKQVARKNENAQSTVLCVRVPV